MISKLFEILGERLMHLGTVPLCNGIASRAPHIAGYCFPLCYRCTFVTLFFLITLYFGYKNKVKMSMLIIVLCMIPMIVDGSLQTFMGMMSNNFRRALTGAVFGFGLGMFITRIYILLDVRESRI